jgi:hypothetical protein
VPQIMPIISIAFYMVIIRVGLVSRPDSHPTDAVSEREKILDGSGCLILSGLAHRDLPQNGSLTIQHEPRSPVDVNLLACRITRGF